MEVIGRILRVAHLADTSIRRVLRREGLDRGGLDVLATLRRSGPPYRLTPTRLAAELVLTTGAMTHRVDALAQAGLVHRFADPADRRSSLVGLTEQGQEAAVRAMTAHLAGEAALLGPLAPADRQALGALLARLLTGIEEEEET
jgi:DNA-binding MarR family transcriptional regulator